MTGIVEIMGTYYSYNTACEDLTLMSGSDGICKIYDKQIFIRPKELMGADLAGEWNTDLTTLLDTSLCML